ncbi:dihydrofolate reductase family protein [Candidatus Woesearchaeota archaeon]|nr:dihydrofolate reductase family protein [Candidatus Woesearchaeota archaeon]
MKVILDMAMTVNGIIARKNFNEDFLSEYNWEVFCDISNKVGCIIIGRKTYGVLTTSEDWNLEDIKNVKKIVVSKKSFKDVDKFFFVKSPKEAINKAESLGFKEVLLAGGGNINSEFMKLGLVNEIFFNINPVILSDGIKVFKESDFQSNLKLINVKELKEGIIRAHYKVLK